MEPQPTTPTPDPAKRFSSPLILEGLKRFAVRLKTNARWMKEFLHGGGK